MRDDTTSNKCQKLPENGSHKPPFIHFCREKPEQQSVILLQSIEDTTTAICSLSLANNNVTLISFHVSLN